MNFIKDLFAQAAPFLTQANEIYTNASQENVAVAFLSVACLTKCGMDAKRRNKEAQARSDAALPLSYTDPTAALLSSTAPLVRAPWDRA